MTLPVKLDFAQFGLATGRAVFFFHGWPGSAKQGFFLDDVAKELGLRIIAVNRPGIGGTKFVSGRKLLDWPPMIAELAADLKLESYSIIAISGGAPYALACAYAEPKLLDQVLIVCGAPLFKLISGTNSLFWVYRVLLFFYRISPWFLSKLINFYGIIWPLKLHLPFLKLLSLSFCEKDKKVFEKQINFKVMLDSMQDEIQAGGEVLLTDAEVYITDPGFLLSDIKKKIIWWHGHKDLNIPIKYAREMTALLPDVELHETVDDGHFSIAITEMDTIIRSVFKS